MPRHLAVGSYCGGFESHLISSSTGIRTVAGSRQVCVECQRASSRKSRLKRLVAESLSPEEARRREEALEAAMGAWRERVRRSLGARRP